MAQDRASSGTPVMARRKTPVNGITWRQPDGRPVSCVEKLAVLNENLEEIRQYCQDAFEDALLMGCDEKQVRQVFESIVKAIENPYRNRKS
jgi:hypothetical protein